MNCYFKRVLPIFPFLLFATAAPAAYVPVIRPHAQQPPSKPQAAQAVEPADGWVICGDGYGQTPTGDGCQVDAGPDKDCSFMCGRQTKIIPYREFLKSRKPEAKFLGVQLYYVTDGRRAIVYYQN